MIGSYSKRGSNDDDDPPDDDDIVANGTCINFNIPTNLDDDDACML